MKLFSLKSMSLATVLSCSTLLLACGGSSNSSGSLGLVDPVSSNNNNLVNGSYSSSNSSTCSGMVKKTCSAMLTCDEAKKQLACGNKKIDKDDDGIPCESLCN